MAECGGRGDDRELKVGYLQCVGGVSGDMLLGAIVDAGVSIHELRDALGALPFSGFTISAQRDKRGGVEGTLVSVEPGSSPRFDTASKLIEAVDASDLGQSAKSKTRMVLERLGAAEASIHGDEAAHLHELGSADTLVDVVGAVVGFEMLGIERLYSSPLPTGSGVFRSEHGPLPAPSPATTALLAIAGAPTVPSPGGAADAGEMVTPTGAAIVTTLAEFTQPAMTVTQAGYGLGSRNPGSYPNVVALRVGEVAESLGASTLSLLETNIDDMSPEAFPYVSERLFELGARDVWLTPINMKKGRTGVMLAALVDPGIERQAVDLMLRETTTLGVRVSPVSRYEAERESFSVTTSIGELSVKIKRLGGSNVSLSPEYEDCRRIARETGLPILDVYRIVQSEAADQFLPTAP